MSSLSNSQATYILSTYIHVQKKGRKEGRESWREGGGGEGERERKKRGRKAAQTENLSYKMRTSLNPISTNYVFIL